MRTPSDPMFASKPAASRRRPLPRPNIAPKQPEVVEVTCTPRHLQPWGVLLAAVIVLAVVVFAVVSYTGKSTRAWNAVFLTNGQVYFGHISRDAQDTIELRDVYYLQVTPPLQQRDANDSAAPAPTAASGNPDITLVKLGNELHGPTDVMSINRAHVLFTEELRNDSTIVQAIAAAQVRAAAPEPPALSTPSASPSPAPSGEAPAEGASAPAVE